ncbi:MAG: SRPBCC domain-containing protein [Bacteroidales bacterium]|jgi:activator of HSP90 ATPase|nr:SRPBCC domain-containing protein [Bacteroidales bacterium]
MRNFKKTFHINAEPSDIYAALTNPYTIELWSGYPATMPAEPGEEFIMWNGDICGKIIEFVPDRKVVQEWYFGDNDVKSIVTISISGKDGNSNVIVEHTNIPAGDYDNIAEGWNEYYMGAIRRFYNPNF